MRIAIISIMAGAQWGGSEELWGAMATEALKEGHEIGAFVYKWPTIPRQLAPPLELGMKIRRRPRWPSLVGERLGVLPYYDVARFKPDIICVNQGCSIDVMYFLSLCRFLKKVNVPYVALCHASVPHKVLSERQRARTIEFFRGSARNIFVSQENVLTVERQLATTIPNTVILQNPVNLEDFSIVPWPVSEPVCMVSVARLEIASKGQDILFEALSQPLWSMRKWHLRIYGRGSSQKYLETLAAHYNIADRVEFRGHVSDIRGIWANNHILVMPSRLEGLPLVLVEAMICGRPAVVTDVGGNRERIDDQTGFIAEAATAHSFGATLDRAWEDRANWETMGQQAHMTVMSLLDRQPGKTLLAVILDAAQGQKIG